MDFYTPVGSLEAWLPLPKALGCSFPQAAPSSPFTSMATSERGCRSSDPIPIPVGLQDARRARSDNSDDPAQGSGLRTTGLLLLEEILGSKAISSANHMEPPGEGTVRRGGRPNTLPFLISGPSVFTASSASPYGQRNDDHTETLDAGAAASAASASLPLPTSHKASPVSLASLCRALSSPAEETGTLACPHAPGPQPAASCVPPTAAEWLVAQQALQGFDTTPAVLFQLPVPSSSSEYIVDAPGPVVPAAAERWAQRDGNNSCGGGAAVATPRPPFGAGFPEPDAEAQAVAVGSCGRSRGRHGAGGPVGPAAAPPLVPSTAKRGLYEGTVRDGSVRNTWRYTYCCTAGG